MVPYLTRAAGLASVALLLAGCNTGPTASQHLSLSVTSRSPSPSASAVSTSIQIGSGANSLTISQAQMVLARLELSPSGGCDTTGEEDDCDELHVGPELITLPVDGTTKIVLDALVPAGTYEGLEAKIDAVDSDDDEQGASAFLTAHPDWKGVSVRVTGVFTDASSQTHAFTFNLEADAHIEAGFSPPVTVGSSTSNLTVAVDVGSWFKDSTGAAIDPTNPANAEAIQRNIRHSFRTFEDDNHDGMDDHEGGGDDHEGMGGDH